LPEPLDLGEDYDQVVHDVVNVALAQPLIRQPRTRATLAALQVMEALASLESVQALDQTTQLLLQKVVPHLIPREAWSARQLLDGLGVLVAGIERNRNDEDGT